MKTMTKEQAFEYLKDKKTMIVDEKQSEEVQKKLFQAGFKWENGEVNVCNTKHSYLFISDCGSIGFYYNTQHFRNSILKFIFAFDILDIEIEDKKEEHQFETGEWVLVRNSANESWEIAQFAYCITHHNGDKEYHTFGGNCYCECVPYAWNECLTGNWDLRNSQHK